LSDVLRLTIDNENSPPVTGFNSDAGFKLENKIRGPNMHKKIKSTKLHPIVHFINPDTLYPRGRCK
jgi:hypothetical protein